MHCKYYLRTCSPCLALNHFTRGNMGCRRSEYFFCERWGSGTHCFEGGSFSHGRNFLILKSGTLLWYYELFDFTKKAFVGTGLCYGVWGGICSRTCTGNSALIWPPVRWARRLPVIWYILPLHLWRFLDYGPSYIWQAELITVSTVLFSLCDDMYPGLLRSKRYPVWVW